MDSDSAVKANPGWSLNGKKEKEEKQITHPLWPVSSWGVLCDFKCLQCFKSWLGKEHLCLESQGRLGPEGEGQDQGQRRTGDSGGVYFLPLGFSLYPIASNVSIAGSHMRMPRESGSPQARKELHQVWHEEHLDS